MNIRCLAKGCASWAAEVVYQGVIYGVANVEGVSMLVCQQVIYDPRLAVLYAQTGLENHSKKSLKKIKKSVFACIPTHDL